MAEVREIGDGNFESEILQSDKPSIVDFWAEWCAPCRAISPIIKELAATYGDQINIVKMNIDVGKLDEDIPKLLARLRATDMVEAPP